PLARQILLRPRVFRNHRPPQREKRRGPIAQPPRPPGHVDAFDRRELAQRSRHIMPVRARSPRDSMRRDQLPASLAEPRDFGVVRIQIHGELKTSLRNTTWYIQVRFEGELLRKIRKLTIHL